MTKTNILKVLAVTLIATVGWLFAASISELFEAGSVWGHLVFGLMVSILMLGLVAVLRRLESKKSTKTNKDFGMSKRLKLLGVGALWFAVPATLLLVAASWLGMVEVEALKSPVEVVGTVLLLALLVALSEAIPEEVVMRGYVFSKLSETGQRWFAIFAQATIFTVFAFMIGALSDPLDASFIFTFGAVLGILRSATGSVFTSIGFHFACMTFQQSFSEHWGILSASNQSMLQMYIFGMIPLSIVSAFFVTKMLNSKQQ